MLVQKIYRNIKETFKIIPIYFFAVDCVHFFCQFNVVKELPAIYYIIMICNDVTCAGTPVVDILLLLIFHTFLLSRDSGPWFNEGREPMVPTTYMRGRRLV